MYEDSDEFARQQERLAEKRRRDDELRAAVEGKGKGKEEDGQPIDYSLYQTFWGLQEHLSDPTRVQQSDEAWGTSRLFPITHPPTHEPLLFLLSPHPPTYLPPSTHTRRVCGQGQGGPAGL